MGSSLGSEEDEDDEEDSEEDSEEDMDEMSEDKESPGGGEVKEVDVEGNGQARVQCRRPQ